MEVVAGKQFPGHNTSTARIVDEKSREQKTSRSPLKSIRVQQQNYQLGETVLRENNPKFDGYLPEHVFFALRSLAEHFRATF